MKSFAFALCAGAVSAIHSIELEYMNYLAKFGKMVNSNDEFEARLSNFAATDQEIKLINASGKSWTAGHNQFSDWTQEEYESILGFNHSVLDSHTDEKLFDTTTNASEVNWVTAGGVTDVKD